MGGTTWIDSDVAERGGGVAVEVAQDVIVNIRARVKYMIRCGVEIKGTSVTGAGYKQTFRFVVPINVVIIMG